MANSIPWDHSPEFLAATQSEIPPGGLTSYVTPRPIGESPSDVTSFIFGLATWSDDEFLPLFYQWEPTADWMAFKATGLPPQKVDANGTSLFERFPEAGKQPEKLLDFPGLPDQIGTQETWEFLEYIRRVDPRIRWIDILMRMQLDGRRSQTALNTEASRGREVYVMSSWHINRKRIRPAIQFLKGNVFDRLTPAQIAANTTRGSTPGLIDPLRGAASRRIDLPRQSILRKPKKPKRGPPRELPCNQVSNGKYENKQKVSKKLNRLRNSPSQGAQNHQDVDDTNSAGSFLEEAEHQQDVDGAINYARTHALQFPSAGPLLGSEFAGFSSVPRGTLYGMHQSVLDDDASIPPDNGPYYPSEDQVQEGFRLQSSTSEAGAASFDGVIFDIAEDNLHDASFEPDFLYSNDTFPSLSNEGSRSLSENQVPHDSRLHPSTNELGAASSETDLPGVEIFDDRYDYYGYEVPGLLWNH